MDTSPALAQNYPWLLALALALALAFGADFAFAFGVCKLLTFCPFFGSNGKRQYGHCIAFLMSESSSGARATHDFVSSFKNGVVKALNYLSSKKYYIFIITNQAGIAKGKFRLIDFFTLHKYIKSF